MEITPQLTQSKNITSLRFNSRITEAFYIEAITPVT